MEDKKFTNENAVSTVVGFVILLAITLLSLSIILLYTTPALSDLQDVAKAQKIEQAFTVFDSRASKASLGESPVQTTRVSIMGGTLEVMGDDSAYNESQIMVVAVSSDSSWYNDFYKQRNVWNSWEDFQDETDFAGYSSGIPMGKIRYETGNHIIAYEGGGVWSKSKNGNTIMVSPPEFHYNYQTLTLPIMRITGNSSVSGSTETTMVVSSSNAPEILFPNAAIDSNFTNPLGADEIMIYINSEFYDGWAKYAESLAASNIALDHENHTAIIQLSSAPTMGTFPLASSFRIIRLNASNPDPMYNFSFYFEDESPEGSNFKSVTTEVTATAGTKKLYYEIGGSKNEVVKIEYTDSSVGPDIEAWTAADGNSFPIYEDPLKGKAANTTYDLLSKDYIVMYNSKKVEEFSWDETSPTTMLPNVSIKYADEYPLYNVTNHYMKLMAQEGVIACTWNQKSNEKILEDQSTYTLVYDAGGNLITYLHITSSELEANLE